MTDTRPLRADAMRNRASLLAAAADEFAERGLDASVADIARRAGVGKGTVFRHFATKDDLIAAIVLDRVGELTAAGDRLRAADDAGDALLEFLTVAAQQRQQRDLSFLHVAGDTNAAVAEARDRMYRTVHDLVDRARAHGALRDDVTGTDVILLMCAPNYVASYVPGASPDLWRRYLGILFDGLRPQGRTRCPSRRHRPSEHRRRPSWTVRTHTALRAPRRAASIMDGADAHHASSRSERRQRPSWTVQTHTTLRAALNAGSVHHGRCRRTPRSDPL